jgi:dTDP-4-amino-4,6-dideoxygalactose transaminase
MKVPQFDLGRAARRIRPQLEERWARSVDRTSFIGGDEVAELERGFAELTGTGGCVGVANGTDALELALRALDLRPGDEVIVPAFTFVATATAVVLAGGVPVAVDVEPSTLNIDPQAAEAAVGAATVGVVGVHLYGRPCNLAALGALCERRGLWLVEDAAQAHGARFDGRPVGGFGRLASWSFYPSKNLGAFGDAGAVTGDEPELVERVRRLSNHGRIDHFTHRDLGRNSRIDALQAAVLNCRLPLLEADNERRRAIAATYRERLAGVEGLEPLGDRPGDLVAYHQMTVRHPRRDALREHLGRAGIGTTVFYPRPIHRQPVLAPWAASVHAPVAERAAETVLSLPMFPELTDVEVDAVCEAIRSF